MSLAMTAPVTVAVTGAATIRIVAVSSTGPTFVSPMLTAIAHLEEDAGRFGSTGEAGRRRGLGPGTRPDHRDDEKHQYSHGYVSHSYGKFQVTALQV